MSQNRLDAVIGFFGGAAYMVGDCLLYLYPGRNASLNIDPVFALMPAWRFVASAFWGLFGMALMLFGFRSLYAMTKEVCGKRMQYFMLLGGFGVAAAALGHFTLGSLLPLTYKAVISAGGSAAMAQTACSTMEIWVMPLNVLIIGALYVQLIVLLYMILSRKSGLSYWYILVGPFGAVAFGMLWYLIFRGTAIQGAWGSCESLGEGLMYLAAYVYWKRKFCGEEEGCQEKLRNDRKR